MKQSIAERTGDGQGQSPPPADLKAAGVQCVMGRLQTFSADCLRRVVKVLLGKLPAHEVLWVAETLLVHPADKPQGEPAEQAPPALALRLVSAEPMRDRLLASIEGAALRLPHDDLATVFMVLVEKKPMCELYGMASVLLKHSGKGGRA